MNDLEIIQDQHSAGPQAIAFDYQFYYFMYLALELRHGQQIGFEIKDDIHIDKADGTTILFQAKHSVLTNADGTPKNLTTLDADLWKTLSNWSDYINAAEDVSDYLIKNQFCLVTNKSDGNNNEFLESLVSFKINNDFDKLFDRIKELNTKTTDDTIKNYIKKVISLGKRKLKPFLSNLMFETNTENIIQRIKDRILENIRQKDLVDSVFESLYSNMQVSKYLEIKDREKYIITFEDFNNKFGRCFRIAFESKPLPRRTFDIDLPENLEDQVFIKQLLDIGEIYSNSPKIYDYTTQMLQTLNQITFWTEKNFVLPTEIEDFEKNSISIWQNEFTAKYRKIEKMINEGTPIENLEDEIKELGIQLVDYIRRQSLSLQTDLGIPLSNGHYYALSDKPEIGWHYEWQDKYKIQ